jgi:hypothetical protein
LYVECAAPLEVRTERARLREALAQRTSDASESVVMRERLSWEALDEVPPEARVTLRTDRRVEPQLADLQALVDRRLGLLR